MKHLPTTYYFICICPKIKYGLILFIGLFLSLTGFSQTNVNTLKAVYLEKFSRFVTWPEECKMDDISEPFIIAVIGKTELIESLHLVYSQQTINNKRVIIKEIKELNEINGVHVLFISGSEKKNLQKILDVIRPLPVLTISETRGFAEKGVLINFFEENKRLRFEINETVLLKSPLKMSYYLLSAAQIIEPLSDKK